MIKVDYDAEYNAIVISFEGNVDAEQAKRSYADLDNVRPKGGKGFKLLADFSGVDAMEPEVQGEMFKAMDLLNMGGVTEIIRVLPDPELEIGFNIMSRAHYSQQVQIHTLRTREEAQAFLQGNKE